ncbi:MAG TPA: FecR family protein [Steroidobacteraceae bacterium]|nr:FecR family protein [Steroidobacteraceae bacterium]
MSCNKKNSLPLRWVVRNVSALLFACAALLAAPAANALDSGDIVLVSSKGEVHITVNGAARNVRAGGVLELPATVRTGRDGNVELKQGATTVSVGPETLLEFPALEKRGAPIDRILQPRGNAFYNIGKREGRKLRVETPYLVAVIKGTQFNVAAEDEATTISLFEGLLEVRAADDSSVVDLKAGEIASRQRGDKSISIVEMDAGKAPPTGPRPPAGSGSRFGTPSSDGGDSLLVDGIDRGANSPRAEVEISTDVLAGGNAVETGAAAIVSVGSAVDATTSVDVSTAGTDVDIQAAAAVSAGNSVDVATNAAVNAGPPAADVATSVAVDVGPAAVDVGVSTAVDVAAGAVDLSAGTAVDVGPVTAVVDTSTAVDLGAGAVDTSVDAGVDAGPLATDVGAGAAVDLTSGTVDAGVIVGASAPLVEVNVGADAAVDAVAGTVNLGVDVAGVDIDLGVDLADPVDTVETVTETVTDTVVDVGGLLEGLLRRPARR